MTPKEQPKRLGRGLAALLGDSAVPSSAQAQGVQTLGIEVMAPGPFQPRREMDPAALAELAASITQRGILQPLLVRPHPTEPGMYQIIAGERRWRAAQQAQLHEVPVLVRALSDIDAMAAGLVENLQRADLNPVEEAMGYQRLLSEFRMTQETLAEALGKSRVHITQSVRMLSLPLKVLDYVRTGSLSAGHARALIKAADPEILAQKIIKDQLSVRKTEDLVAGLAGKTKSEKPVLPAEAIDRETDILARGLSEKLGLNVKLLFDGKGGTVTLNYRTLDQLDEIIALLNA